MTCKDCIHQTACFDWCRGFGQEAELCEHFSDKSEWVHMLCKVGDRVFSIVIIGGEYSVVADRVHALKISTENIYAETNWYVDGGEIGYNVFLTQKEAEKALAERRKDNAEIH